MANRTPLGLLMIAVAAGQVGCDGATASSPTAPSAVVQGIVPTSPAPGYVPGHVLQGVALFGQVFEAGAAGLIPLADVTVYCDACGAEGHSWTRSDGNGNYRFAGDLEAGGGIWILAGHPTTLWLEKEGYDDPPGQPVIPSYNGPGWRWAPIAGDTQFDMLLVKR